MNCNTPIDSATGLALEGEALDAALKDPGSSRCGYDLSPDDVFCPSCGAKVEYCATSRRGRAWYSCKGRASRKEFWITSLIIGLCGSAFIGIMLWVYSNKMSGSYASAYISVFALSVALVGIAVGLVSIPISLRRLHDLGWSGLILLPSLCIGFTTGMLRICSESGDSVAAKVLNVIGMIINLLLFVPMGFKRGTRGFNHYGLDPLKAK